MGQFGSLIDAHGTVPGSPGSVEQKKLGLTASQTTFMTIPSILPTPWSASHLLPLRISTHLFTQVKTTTTTQEHFSLENSCSEFLNLRLFLGIPDIGDPRVCRSAILKDGLASSLSLLWGAPTSSFGRGPVLPSRPWLQGQDRNREATLLE